MWSDELVVVHISKGKTKEKEPWDQGGAVIAGMKTALQPYKHDVFDLEVRRCMLCSLLPLSGCVQVHSLLLDCLGSPSATQCHETLAASCT
jgi:hypothetical protein